MMKELEEEFSQLFTAMFSGFGLPELSLRVLALLYLEPGELAMDEIAGRTGYSLASISTTMKTLENAGFAQRRKRPATRKIFFSMDKSLAKINIRRLQAAQRHVIDPAKQGIPCIIEKFAARAKDERSRQQLKIIESYHRQLAVFETLIAKWTKELDRP